MTTAIERCVQVTMCKQVHINIHVYRWRATRPYRDLHKYSGVQEKRMTKPPGWLINQKLLFCFDATDLLRVSESEAHSSEEGNDLQIRSTFSRYRARGKTGRGAQEEQGASGGDCRTVVVVVETGLSSAGSNGYTPSLAIVKLAMPIYKSPKYSCFVVLAAHKQCSHNAPWWSREDSSDRKTGE